MRAPSSTLEKVSVAERTRCAHDVAHALSDVAHLALPSSIATMEGEYWYAAAALPGLTALPLSLGDFALACWRLSTLDTKHSRILVAMGEYLQDHIPHAPSWDHSASMDRAYDVWSYLHTHLPAPPQLKDQLLHESRELQAV